MPNRTRPALALLLALAACDLPTGPSFPADELVPYDRPPQYALWWSVVEQCSGRTGDLAAMHWYRTRDGDAMTVDGSRYDGYWWERGHRIAVSDPLDGPTVRHEMLHALLDDGGHPLEYFASRCDGIVIFEIPDDYGVPAEALADTTLAPANRSLRVVVAPVPAQPRFGEYDGWLLLDVSAVNTTGTPIWVRLWGLNGAYSVENPEFSVVLNPDWRPRLYFAPGQRRHALLDFHVAAPGAYEVTGSYANAPSPLTEIRVEP